MAAASSVASRTRSLPWKLKKKKKKKKKKNDKIENFYVKKQDSDKYDSVYVELQTSKRNKLTVGTVYRPPKQRAADDAALYEKIQALTQYKQSVIIG